MGTKRVSPCHVESVLLTALVLFFVPATQAQAQCLNGFEYAICPNIGIIFMQDGKSLAAMRIPDGTLIWETALPQSDVSFNGPVATPDSVVVFAGFPDTYIYAFDAATGRPIWHLETSSRGLSSAGSYIFMNDPKYWDGLTALDGKTGKAIWHHPANPPGSVGAGAGSGQVLLTKLHAIDADTGRVLQNWPRRWDVTATAFVGRFRAIGTSRGQMAVYSSSGQMLWAKRDPKRGHIADLAADQKHILAARYDGYYPLFRPGHGTLELMSAASGKTIWSKEIVSHYMLLPSSVALVGGVAIVVTADSRNSGLVEAFDAATGQQKWAVHTGRGLTDGPVCFRQSCYIAVRSPAVLKLDAVSGAHSWLALPRP